MALLSRTSVFDKGRGMKGKKQWMMMHDMCQDTGKEGNMSHIHLPLSGQGVFRTGSYL